MTSQKARRRPRRMIRAARSLRPQDGAGTWLYPCRATCKGHECAVGVHDDWQHQCACGFHFGDSVKRSVTR